MGKLGRDKLRREAKKEYKEQAKGVPKKNRMPFSEFFKKYKESKGVSQVPEIEAEDSDTEDFNFEDIINVNEVGEDSLEIEGLNVDKDDELEEIINSIEEVGE